MIKMQGYAFLDFTTHSTYVTHLKISDLGVVLIFPGDSWAILIKSAKSQK